MLNLAGGAPPLETAAALGRLSTLASLTSLSLQAGPMHGLLRHLRLPTGVKAGFPSNAFRCTAAAAPACKYVLESCSGHMRLDGVAVQDQAITITSAFELLYQSHSCGAGASV